jgi:hypothetical protein
VDTSPDPLLLFIAAFALGALPLPRWTVLVVPALFVPLSILSYMNESPTYDMKGASLYFGALFAGASVLFWLIGRVPAIIGRKLHAKRRAPDIANPS